MAGWEESESILEVNGKSYTRQELLAYWITERESIREKKEAGLPKPWSEDWVFQSTYFCNVHREDDRVTKWIRQNYTPEVFGLYYEPAIVAARLFNRIETLEKLKYELFPLRPAELYDLLESIQAEGRLWGNAYVITTCGVPGSKISYAIELLQSACDLLPFRTDHLSEYSRFLTSNVRGLGDFLAGQIVADLKNTLGHPLINGVDWWTFANPGPGSMRGLQWFFEDNVTRSFFRVHILQVMDYLKSELGGHATMDRMCMQDLQNCLCEFDKYCRVLTNSGRSKRIYDARG